jgi:hypothetical protein
MRRALLLAAALAAPALLAAPSTAATLRFGDPVLLTQPNLGGFEPGIQVDRFNNVYVTAHKQRHINVISPDPQTPTGVRTASFVWTSADGVHFRELTPDQRYTMQFGDEGDLALDDAGHLYFVDTNVPDSTFTRWRIGGRGRQTMELTRPVIPSGQPVDDRPWIAAHGNGTVLYTTNAGLATANPVADRSAGSGSGPGRFTAYMSHDGGQTFDPRGVSLRDSGWCRPAADHRPGSKTLYVVCIDIDLPDQVYAHALYVYVSHDDGATWTRRRIARYESAGWPSVAVARDGSVYASIPDGHENPDGTTSDRVRVFHSTTGGRTWSERTVPWRGEIPYSWLDVAPDGTVGVGFYSRPSASSPWFVYAAEAPPGGAFALGRVSSKPIASADGFPRGDFFQVAFGPDSRLNVVWTRLATLGGADATYGDNSDVLFARQR